ncbi:AF4/FMR2 family member 4 isoform X2 [Sphaeramia orbicularis]|uniref:AF4/FMR2 family member 4 isoform X2 n=1 Tax=Sphaeramia orbicularis TaxID=375764 RepID=UPI00118093BD|nr:AF4/FMR2 family member 4-like isoform X2 [Sphaeramia orbicularis]
MASEPSEERNLLRLRAWEQRNQETGQAKELSLVNVPLFGEPYKTTKGDELSDRIRRMLGSYEDNCTVEPLSFPTYETLPQSDQVQSNAEKSSKPPFHNQVCCTSTQSQKGPTSNACPTQPTRTPALSSPIHQEHLSKVPVNHGQDSQFNRSTYQQPKSDAFSDLREPVNLSQEKPAESPDAKPPPFLHSSDHNKTEPKDMHANTFERHQGSAEYPPDSASTTDASVANLTQASKDVSPPHSKNICARPSQTFPPPLSAKQPSAAMTKKPTAYVRPMDGQDQVIGESPELKPSPEPYAPLPEITLNKSNQGKKKILPQYLETKTTEVHCVEDILREMTHSWPPLLTTIHTPCTDEPSKSPFPAKEAGHVSSYPGQKTCHPSTTAPTLLQHNSSSLPAEPHSSEVECSSSSDSETSSKSESDSESTIEEPLQPLMSSSVKTDMSAPAVTHSDWQLGNWIRSNQQNSSSDGLGAAHASESPTTHKQIPPTHGFKHTSVDAVHPTRESQSQLPSNQNQFSDNLTNSQQCSTSCQDSYYQQRSQKPSSTDLSSCTGIRKCSGNTQLSDPAKSALTDNTEDALSVKSDQTTTIREKDSCFSKRPKVKTKTGRCKKSEDGSNTKKDSVRTAKHSSLDKRKTGSEPGHDASPVQCGHCLSCGMRYSKPCSCPTHSLLPPDQPSPATSVTFSCSKPEAETICQKTTKMPQKMCPEIPKCSERTAKVSQDNSKAPRSLVVKINLKLLSRIPCGFHQDTPSSTKTPVVVEPHGGSTDVCLPHKLSKTSLKTTHPNVEVDNKTVPRKKRRLENKSSSSVTVSFKGSSNPSEDREQKKAKKKHTSLHLTSTPGGAMKRTQREQKSCSGETRESSMEAGKSRDSHKHKKSSGKKTEHPDSEKKPATDSLALPSRSEPTTGTPSSRPLLTFEDRQYPVKHYIKEAKRLKHKADAESDKLSKVFNYLDAALYFIESGNAMEKDPQISLSSYTMFAETVELLKFVLKLLSSAGSCTSPTEKDFLALCLRCQSLLQMAMFRCKQKTALKYSKTLTDHFNSSAQATPDRSKGKDTPSTVSPANTPSSSGPGSTHSSAGCVVGPLSSTVAVPQAIEQVAFTYVNITTLLLSAHELWEQAEELAHKGTGLLTELDSVVGRLSLTSSMNAMVRYTRQGLHWLRTDGQKVK